MKNKKLDVSTIKWLGVAIASEQAALGDYLKYAHQTMDKTGKDMFIKLARDEFHHMTILERERERLRSGRAWQSVKIPPSPIALCEALVGSTPKASAPGGTSKSSIANNKPISQEPAQSNETQVLELAMKAEKKAMEFYLAQSKKVADASARNLLERLAKMENAHYQILQAELDNINKTGFWMGFSEISMEVE